MTLAVKVYNESAYAESLRPGDLMLYPEPSADGDAVVVQVAKTEVVVTSETRTVHVTYEVPHAFDVVDVFTEAFNPLTLVRLVRVRAA